MNSRLVKDSKFIIIDMGYTPDPDLSSIPSRLNDGNRAILPTIFVFTRKSLARNDMGLENANVYIVCKVDDYPTPEEYLHFKKVVARDYIDNGDLSRIGIVSLSAGDIARWFVVRWIMSEQNLDPKVAIAAVAAAAPPGIRNRAYIDEISTRRFSFSESSVDKSIQNLVLKPKIDVLSIISHLFCHTVIELPLTPIAPVTAQTLSSLNDYWCLMPYPKAPRGLFICCNDIRIFAYEDGSVVENPPIEWDKNCIIECYVLDPVEWTLLVTDVLYNNNEDMRSRPYRLRLGCADSFPLCPTIRPNAIDILANSREAFGFPVRGFGIRDGNKRFSCTNDEPTLFVWDHDNRDPVVIVYVDYGHNTVWGKMYANAQLRNGVSIGNVTQEKIAADGLAVTVRYNPESEIWDIVTSSGKLHPWSLEEFYSVYPMYTSPLIKDTLVSKLKEIQT